MSVLWQVILGKLDALLCELAQMCVSPSKARLMLPKLGGVEAGAARTVCADQHS